MSRKWTFEKPAVPGIQETEKQVVARLQKQLGAIVADTNKDDVSLLVELNELIHCNSHTLDGIRELPPLASRGDIGAKIDEIRKTLSFLAMEGTEASAKKSRSTGLSGDHVVREPKFPV